MIIDSIQFETFEKGGKIFIPLDADEWVVQRVEGLILITQKDRLSGKVNTAGMPGSSWSN